MLKDFWMRLRYCNYHFMLISLFFRSPITLVTILSLILDKIIDQNFKYVW